MVDPALTLLDVDWSNGGNDWQDRVTIGNAGAVLTAVNPAFVSVLGLVATGIGGNVANSSTNGNVNVSINSVLVDLPEPTTFPLIVAGVCLIMIGRSRSTRPSQLL
ncbi:MAG: hypothetical protein HY235_17230 [Acidobacteria bacterium]|nr:hypothetical protein [Acidobacteriota bacterium]